MNGFSVEKLLRGYLVWPPISIEVHSQNMERMKESHVTVKSPSEFSILPIYRTSTRINRRFPDEEAYIQREKSSVA